MARGFFSSVPKLIALGGVLPLLVLLLWLTWHVAQKNRDVASWPQVLAQVVAVTDDRVQLQFFLHGDLLRGDVKKEYAFAKLVPYETIQLLANPSNPAELSAAGFGDVWAGTIALGVVSMFVAIVGIFLLHTGEPRTPAEMARRVQQARRKALVAAEVAPHTQPRNDSDTIEMREPRQSWKANVFWGSLLGLAAVVPAFFAPADASLLEKYGSLALGVAWMAFMGASAYRNYGRTVRCDEGFIHVSQAFGSKLIALSDVKKIAREDVRQQMRDIENIGVSRYDRMRRLDTRARTVMYVLYDGQGKTLLRLDEGMEPGAEMARFLRRLEEVAGPIAT